MSVRHYLSTGSINLLLRGLALAGKFVFVLYLARYFTLDDLGRYGLLASIVLFSIQLVGMDYYVYNGRRILRTQEGAERICHIREQLRFHSLAYLLFIPVYIALIASNMFDVEWVWALLILVIIVAEHLSQESSRLLTTLSRSPEANAVFFVRTALWMLAFMAITYGNSELNNLSTMMLFWVTGACVASLVAAWRIWRLFDWPALRGCKKPDWPELIRGAKYSLPFFLATVALQIIEVSDRFFVEFFLGTASVGVYVFSQNMASLLQTLAVVGLISVIAPKLIGSYLQKNQDEYRSSYRTLVILVMLLMALSVPVIVFVFPMVAEISGKREIMESSRLFSIVLSGYVLSVLSILPYYSMYVRHKDWLITGTTVIAAVVNIILNMVFIPIYGLEGAAYATLVAFAVVLGFRSLIVFRYRYY